MTEEWPDRKERKRILQIHEKAKRKRRIAFTKDEIASYREMMALTPEERFRRGILMIIPNNSEFHRNSKNRG